MKRTAGKARHSQHTHIEPLEHRQLLSATLSVSNSLLVFNAVKGTTSTTETLTITDTGNSALTLGSGAFSLTADSSSPTNDTARFSILNATSAPSSLSPGGSFTLNLSYNANAIVTNKALLEIATNDPVNPHAAVSLHGIGTKGLGGSNQPSLATILQAYNIPTYVGEGFDDANAATDSTYPYPPDASSQEVVMQSFVKAGSGPVTINVLASFTASGFSKSYELGTYPQGTPNDLSELFYTNSTQNQTTYVQPIGATTFDPGSTAFGFYAVSNVQTKGRVLYSEDAYNTFDTTTGRHFRFFPMENSNGSVVPNTYIMTSTEWNAPVGYDFTNIVAVVSNIKAAPNAPASPAVSLQPSNPLPGTNRMLFNNILIQNTSVGDTFHNTGTLNVTDTGNSPLVISSYSLSSGWSLVSPPSFPLTIQPGKTTPLTIKFTQSTVPSHSYNETNDIYEPNNAAGMTGSLTLNTNDPNHSSVSQPLAGWFQTHSENSEEPSLQTMVNLLAGWDTNIDSSHISNLTETTTTTGSPTYYGQEVVSAYWQEADTTAPVTVQQLAAFHTQGNTATTSYYIQGRSGSPTKLFNTSNDYGQTFFPFASNNSGPAAASFSTTSAFGFICDGNYTDDSLNKNTEGGGHHMRFYPVVDSTGAIVPNTYLMCMDYAVTPENFDFQDNVWIVSNIKPVTTATSIASPQTTAAPATPIDFHAAGTASGILLQWATVSGAAGYNVYRSTSETGTYSQVNSSLITSASFTDTGVSSGTTYFYKVTSYDSTLKVNSLAAISSTTAITSGKVTPAQPASFTASGVSGGISLSWSAVSDPTLGGYYLYSSSSSSGTYNLLQTLGSSTTSFTDTSASTTAPTYYQIRAFDGSSGYVSTPASASATAISTSTTGLTSIDIGATPSGSTTVITPNVDYNVTAGGPGVAANADGFRFIYQQQTGNFDMSVQVTSLTVAGNYATAGILARTALTTTSPDVYMSASPVNYRFKWRTTDGGTNNVTSSGTVVFPNAYVRLTRVGNVFTGYYSTDGKNWTVASTQTIALPSTLYLGLAVASNVTTATTTAALRGYGATSTTPTAPAAVTGLTATGQTGSVLLKWNASSDTTLKGYNVYSSSSSGGTYSLLTSSPITSTTYTDSAAALDVPTYYKVTVVDASSGLESNAATANATATSTASAPAPVTGLTATGQVGSVTLSWNASTDSTLKGYNVYSSSSSGGTYNLLTSTPITATTYTDSSATLGSPTYYKVTVVDASTGLESTAATASATATAAATPPAAVTGLSATGQAGSILLSWNPSTDATLKGYNVYSSSSSNGTYTLLTFSPTTTAGYTDGSAAIGSPTYYKVTVVDASSGLESAAATTSATALATSGLTSVDIGAKPSGSTTVVTPNLDYNVTAGGPGVAANADGFRFIYQQQTGNFDVMVQVTSLTVAGNYSTAGILARSALTTTAPDVYMSASPVNYRFKWRTTDAGVNNVTSASTVSFPNAYVRLTRVGNLFTGYYSTNGTTWTALSSQTVALPSTVYLGLAVASNNTTQTTSATLRGYGPTSTGSTPTAPAAVTGLTAKGQAGSVLLNWNASSDSTLKGYNVYSSSSLGGTYKLLTTSPITGTSYTDSSATIGSPTYYKVTVVDASSGLESTAATASATATSAPTALTSADIGATPGGSTTVNGGSYTVTAGGPGIAANADGFRYLYTSVTGNFDVSVQVTSLTVAGNYSTAGILARSSLTTTSPDVYMSASPVNYRFKWRTTDGGINNISTGSTVTFPNAYVRLTRVGNVFTGYYSTNGTTWTELSSETVALPSTIYLGLAVASNNTTQTTTATMQNYTGPT